MELTDIIASLNALLEPQKYHDYAPNGLQVEGRHDCLLYTSPSPRDS